MYSSNRVGDISQPPVPPQRKSSYSHIDTSYESVTSAVAVADSQLQQSSSSSKFIKTHRTSSSTPSSLSRTDWDMPKQEATNSKQWWKKLRKSKPDSIDLIHHMPQKYVDVTAPSPSPIAKEPPIIEDRHHPPATSFARYSILLTDNYENDSHYEDLLSIFNLLHHELSDVSSPQLEMLRLERMSLYNKKSELGSQIRTKMAIHEATLRMMKLYSSRHPISQSTSHQLEPVRGPSSGKELTISVPQTPRSSTKNQNLDDSQRRMSVRLPPTTLRDPYEATNKAFVHSTHELLRLFAEYMQVCDDLKTCTDQLQSKVATCLLDGYLTAKQDRDVLETESKRWERVAKELIVPSTEQSYKYHTDPAVRSVIGEWMAESFGSRR